MNSGDVGLAPALDTFIARFVPLERDGNQALTPS